MVAGNPELRNFTNTEEQLAVSYACLNYNGPATPQTQAFPTVNCPDGLRAQVYFPSCWDGVNLDSPDHKSHMAYPIGQYDDGTCPDSHPQPLISIFYEVIWNTPDFASDWYGSGQPFVWSMGDPTGYGYHGDFVSKAIPHCEPPRLTEINQVNGWDVNLLQEAVTQCTNLSGNVQDCPVFQLTPDAQAEGCMIGIQVDEPTQGVLSELPGCNPITSGPAPAVPGGSCNATTTVSPPASFFTDLTSSKHWYYVGCGTDGFGSRTLTGPSQSLDNMTVETCVDFCNSQGYSIAGTEYVTQCFCGNSIPSGNAPIPGLVGACTDMCGGDDTEYCGGYGAISLYEKCGSTCVNAAVGGLNGSGGTSGNTTASTTSAGSTSSGGTSSAKSAASASNSGASSAASSAAAAAPASSSSTDDDVTSNDDQPAASSAAAAAPASTSSASSITNVTSVPSNVTLPAGWKAVGCYSDNLNPRSLGFNGWWGVPVTSSGCANFCNNQGYTFAGTENAGQCFCGDELVQSTQQPSSDCNMACKGDASQICGGGARLSLFTSQPSVGKVRRAHKHRRAAAHHLEVMS